MGQPLEESLTCFDQIGTMSAGDLGFATIHIIDAHHAGVGCAAECCIR
jgi:hypothetical protein